MYKHKQNLGFTIVELLVVIVVIGILAAITIIAFTGVSQKAVAASLQSDLSGASRKLQMYQVEHGSYPSVMSSPTTDGTICPTAPADDPSYCIKPSFGNRFTYTPAVGSSPQSFTLDNTKTSTSIVYRITESTSPVAYIAPIGPETVTIGSQIWMKYNMNVGIRIDGSSEQANNPTLEKYCYGDLESNCDIYGGLYTWNEAMQYVTAEGAQGICPDGFHIPTFQQYIDLANEVGGEELAGFEIQSSGSSGFNGLLSGFMGPSPTFIDERGYYWTSSPDRLGGAMASLKPFMIIIKDDPNVDWFEFGPNTPALSVRCVKN